jgi:hypothetical protein
MSVVVSFGFQDNDHVFTNGYAFQQTVSRFVTKDSALVRISTYNVGISDHDGATVNDFVKDLCVAEEVRLLVGFNPNHTQNMAFTAKYKELAKQHKNLKIRRLEKLHAKIVSVEYTTPAQKKTQTRTWTGSLNLVTPTLHDLMFKLYPTQSREVCNYFDRLWNFSSVLFNP